MSGFVGLFDPRVFDPRVFQTLLARREHFNRSRLLSYRLRHLAAADSATRSRAAGTALAEPDGIAVDASITGRDSGRDALGTPDAGTSATIFGGNIDGRTHSR